MLFVEEVDDAVVGQPQFVRIEYLPGDHGHVIPNAIVQYILRLLDKILLDLAEEGNDTRLEKCLFVLHNAFLGVLLRVEECIDDLYIDGKVRSRGKDCIIVGARDTINI